MPRDSSQSAKNHARIVPLYHLVAGPIFFANFFWSAYRAIRQPSGPTIFALLLAIAFIILFFFARVFALTVQDRLIRLEMRLRLKGLLPPDLQPRINDLTPRQLVALRFASDAEIADLVREVLAGKLSTSKEIKMRVKNWQPDWLRA